MTTADRQGRSVPWRFPGGSGSARRLVSCAGDLTKGSLQHRSDELGLREGVPFSRLQRVSVVVGRERSLERQIFDRKLRMLAKMITEREMLALLPRAAHAKMHMVCAWPLRRLLKERIDPIERSQGYVDIAEVTKKLDVLMARLKRLHRDLDVYNRLCCQARDRGRPDVLYAKSALAKHRAKACGLRLEQSRPSCVVRQDGDHWAIAGNGRRFCAARPAAEEPISSSRRWSPTDHGLRSE